MRNILTVPLFGLMALATMASAADLAPRRPVYTGFDAVVSPATEPEPEPAAAPVLRRKPKPMASKPHKPIRAHAAANRFTFAAGKAKQLTREGRAVAVVRRVARPALAPEPIATTSPEAKRDIEMMPAGWTTRAQGATPARAEPNGPFGRLK